MFSQTADAVRYRFLPVKGLTVLYVNDLLSILDERTTAFVVRERGTVREKIDILMNGPSGPVV